MSRNKSRSKPKEQPDLGPEAGPTFGEVLEQSGLLGKLSGATRNIIAQTNDFATDHSRRRLTVISCFTCTAPKACCSLTTSCYLYEAVPIAARLLREGRDTPELRAQLKEAAHKMETTRGTEYRRPCVFLDEAELCTIYEDRPSVCGAALVTSPAHHCSDPTVSEVVRIVVPLREELCPQFEEQFRAELSLRRTGRVYRGTLPRMVLLALEAWPRRDYATFLAERSLPAAARLDWASGLT